jgi:hypothetical protein
MGYFELERGEAAAPKAAAEEVTVLDEQKALMSTTGKGGSHLTFYCRSEDLDGKEKRHPLLARAY